MSSFVKDLQDLINRHSRENDSDTPDFILAGLVEDLLHAYSKAVRARDRWYGHEPWSSKLNGAEQDGVLSGSEYRAKSTYEKFADKQNENKGTAID